MRQLLFGLVKSDQKLLEHILTNVTLYKLLTKGYYSG